MNMVSYTLGKKLEISMLNVTAYFDANMLYEFLYIFLFVLLEIHSKYFCAKVLSVFVFYRNLATKQLKVIVYRIWIGHPFLRKKTIRICIYTAQLFRYISTHLVSANFVSTFCQLMLLFTHNLLKVRTTSLHTFIKESKYLENVIESN